MRIKSLFTLLTLVLVVLGLVLSLSGCSDGTSQPSSDPEPVAADTTESVMEAPEPVEVAPDVEEPEPADAAPVEDTTEPSVAVEVEPSTEPAIEEPVEQPVLSWARDAGGLNHCDRFSVYGDGRVEATVCNATAVEPTIHSTLTEAQLAQLLAWAAEYAPFTRREMEMSSAVRTTTLYGTGGLSLELEAKKEITAFAADLYFGLTNPK